MKMQTTGSRTGLIWDMDGTLVDSYPAIVPAVKQACGECGLFFEPVLGLWDFAASACILTEAGGRITDMDGNALTFDRGGSVVAVSRGVAGEDYLALFREHP